MAPTNDSTAVSVLVAAHSPTYLEEALRSALDQTHRGLEIVVVDDSLGQSVEAITNGLGDDRLRYIRNEVRLGPAGTYARALAAASSPVAGILNDDDNWKPTLVEDLLAALTQEPAAVVAFGDHDVLVDGRVDEEASAASSLRWGRTSLAPGLHLPFRREALVERSLPLAVAALFRTSVLQGETLPAEIGGAYDLYLSYLLSRDGGGAVFVPKRLASWRSHSGNLTADRSIGRAEEGAHAYEPMLGDPRLEDVRRDIVGAYRQALWTVATRSLRWGSRARTTSAALRAIRAGEYRAAILFPLMLMPRSLLARR